MSSSVVIRVECVSKIFHLFNRPGDRLKQFFFAGLSKVFRTQSKRYFREFIALNKISFSVNKGETVGIVGRNGSGKSTLLQIICNTLQPSLGSVSVRGRIAALLELGSGFNSEYSGRENAYIYGMLLGMTAKEVEEKFDQIVSFSELEEFIDQPIKTYSSGMTVRLAFSVAIHLNPEILVVDEALSVGDELFQRKCFSKIEQLKASGITILFVSHSAAQVIELCDSAILIDDGEIVTQGKPKEVVSLYQKLLYAPRSKREEIKKSISEKSQVAEVDESVDVEIVKNTESSEFYDPLLTPTSTIRYEDRGVAIIDPHIYTEGIGRVNNLVIGKSYKYKYKVIFSEDAENVRFGMLIKTTSGLELAGGVSASSEIYAIKDVSCGVVFNIEFEFICLLNPGTYFLNAGVLGSVNGLETYLNRVIDAAMFRVMPQVQTKSTGWINLISSVSIN